MEYSDRLFLINRISAGILKFKNVYIFWPSSIDRYLSSEVYQEIYKQALLNGALVRDETLHVLFETGQWTAEMGDKWDMAEQDIENCKIKLFQQYSNKVQRAKLKKYLGFVRSELLRMLEIKQSLDFLTAEGIAEYLQLLHIIKNSCYFDYGRKQKYDFETYSLIKIIKHYQQNVIDPALLRDLAKQEPWNTTWQTRKINGTVFDNYPLTFDQEQLMGWSMMYDNIKESPECPSDIILKDNDAVDGWMLVTRKKRDREKKQKDLETGLNDRVKKADEVYLFAQDMEEAKEIYDMNDEYGKAMKSKRFAYLHKYGQAQVQELPDIKQKLQMEINKRSTTKK